MPVLENPRHETFAQGVASGLTAVEAYERAGYRGGGNAASRLHGTEAVRGRVRELQEITSARAGMSREQAVAMCIEILKAPPSAAHLDHALCELKMGKDGPYAIFPDKRGVMERLAKMLGWDEPEKHEVQMTGPRAVLAGVMGRGKREEG